MSSICFRVSLVLSQATLSARIASTATKAVLTRPVLHPQRGMPDCPGAVCNACSGQALRKDSDMGFLFALGLLFGQAR